MKKYQWNILGLCEVRCKKKQKNKKTKTKTKNKTKTKQNKQTKPPPTTTTLKKHLPQKATSSFSVAMKTDLRMELDSSFTKTL